LRATEHARTGKWLWLPASCYCVHVNDKILTYIAWSKKWLKELEAPQRRHTVSKPPIAGIGGNNFCPKETNCMSSPWMDGNSHNLFSWLKQ
jgi:hypothetical protein